MPVGLFSWTEHPICLCTFISFYPKVSSQFKPKGTCSVSSITNRNGHRGTLHPPGPSPGWPQSTGACSEPLGTGITEEWRVWSQVPLLASSNINKYVNHCKSVNNCQMGNELHIICKITITGPTQAFCFRDCSTPTPNYLKCTLLVAILVMEQLFWCRENKRLG